MENKDEGEGWVSPFYSIRITGAERVSSCSSVADEAFLLSFISVQYNCRKMEEDSEVTFTRPIAFQVRPLWKNLHTHEL